MRDSRSMALPGDWQAPAATCRKTPLRAEAATTCCTRSVRCGGLAAKFRALSIDQRSTSTASEIYWGARPPREITLHALNELAARPTRRVISWRPRLRRRRPGADAHQVLRPQPLAKRLLHGRGIECDVVLGGARRLIERQPEIGAPEQPARDVIEP